MGTHRVSAVTAPEVMTEPVVTVCSRLSRELDEPLAGTAPVAATWILLEQPGPWGRKALTESHLDPAVGAALETSAAAHSARAALIRRPGPHPDDHRSRQRQIWVASTRPGNTWLLGGLVGDAGELGNLSWSGVERADVDLVRASLPALRPEPEPLLLVCTNGRRDVCCASFGRPVATAMHQRSPGRVWETTHLGGHRFAPTAAVLPAGVVYGRLDADAASHILGAARKGRFVLAGYRGRSTFEPPVQAAEAAVRRVAGLTGLDDVDVATARPVDGAGESWRIVMTHADGRRWRVGVTRHALEPPRPESCTGQAVQPIAHVADDVVLEPVVTDSQE
jgi:hypothetical protein